MNGLAVYVKEGLPFVRELSLESSEDSYLCFRLAFLHPVSYFFFLYQSPSSLLCTVFDSISSNINEVLWINPSANVFVFGDFNVHTADLLTVVSERVARAFKRSRATRAVALDISNVLDKVWPAGLLHRLRSYGISGQIFGLISLFSVIVIFEWF